MAYHIRKADEEDAYVAVVFNVGLSSVQRICYADSEITKMCTGGSDDVLICGTSIGSLILYDLKDYDSISYISQYLNWDGLIAYQQQAEGVQNEGQTNQQERLANLKAKYTPKTASFITDGMPDYPHFTPVEKLMCVNKYGAGNAQIGVLDQAGIVSMWSVVEMDDHIAEKMQDFELNMSVGCHYKMIENFNQDLTESGVAEMATGLELEFDQTDSNIFFFGCSDGLFKVDRRISHEPTKLSTEGLGSPSALSMSDGRYLLVGFTCGSIGLYNTEYTQPLTIWYNACSCAIRQIKWCMLYFSDDSGQLSKADSP